MIKAEELRLRNLITTEFHHGLGPLTVVSITTINNIKNSSAVFDGIPLTKEWLEKFGFTHNKDLNIWNRDEEFDMCISYIESKKDEFRLYVNHEYEEGEPFKFVHQLQNLYFALNQKELIYTP